MTSLIRREDTGVPWRYAEWYDGTCEPASGLQVEAGVQRPRLLGPDGRPAPRLVHRVGFQPRMVVEE